MDMDYKDYCAALERLKLTIVGAAPVVGLSRRQVQRLAAGDSPVPRPVAKLVNLMLKRKVSVEEVTKAG